MIVAGIGFKEGATAADIDAAIEAATRLYGISRNELTRLSTLDRKAASQSGKALARALALPLDAATSEDLAPFASRCLSSSDPSLRVTGLPSLAEAAALWSAEQSGTASARLLGPRITTEHATCALATTAPEILT